MCDQDGDEDALARLEDARVLLGVLLCLDACAVGRLSSADTRRTGLGGEQAADAVWCHLCEQCWRGKSARYRPTPERARGLTATKRGRWRDHYRDAAEEGRRGRLRPEELAELRWAFNFTPTAGGLGSLTMQFVEFRPREPGSPVGNLLMQGYLPLLYALSDDGKQLNISSFPLHDVQRLTNWEWEITNDNVTFASCVGDDVQYSDRNFLDFTAGDLVTQTGGLLRQDEAEELLRSGGALPRRVLLFSLLHDVFRGGGGVVTDAVNFARENG